MRPSVLDGPGAVHIDRITADCLTRRDPANVAAIRLEVAVIAADILDSARGEQP